MDSKISYSEAVKLMSTPLGGLKLKEFPDIEKKVEEIKMSGGLGSAINFKALEEQTRRMRRGLPNPPALMDHYMASVCNNELYIEFAPHELHLVQNFYHLNSGGHMIHLDFNRIVPGGEEPLKIWGSMSNCFNVQIQQVPTGLLYRFDTYHGPPFRYYVELSKKFNTLKFVSTAYDTKSQLRYSTVALKNGDSFYQH